MTNGYWDLLIKEAINIKIHTNNFNGDKGLQLSETWDPFLSRIDNRCFNGEARGQTPMTAESTA